MEFKIIQLPQMRFVGRALPMSFNADRTPELWRGFSPRKPEIGNTTGTELYSITIYKPGFFAQFDPNGEFEKWAAVAVTGFENIPEGMQTLVSPEGTYAAFTHRGTAAESLRTYDYIFREWLPGSDFLLDDRPHFAVMKEDYRPDDPDAEEAILIPVKQK